MLRILVAILLALTSYTVNAQLTQNLLIDSKALALGNAVTADPPGIKAIHYNPAGLTLLKGRNLEMGFFNVYMDIDADFIAPPGYNIFGIDGSQDPVAGHHSHTNQLALYIPGYGIFKLPKGPGFIPDFGFSINNPGSKFTFGQTIYAPMAAGYYRAGNDPARYLVQSSGMERLTYLSPSFGYQINDEWSVGFGVHISYNAIAASTQTRAPNMLLGVAQVLQDAFNCKSGNEPLAPLIALCGGEVGPWKDIGSMKFAISESASPSYNMGVLWRPNDWFSWGADYSSEASMHLKGTFELDYTKDWSGFWQSVNGSIMGAIGSAILSLPSGVPKEKANTSVNLTYPQHFQTGISVKVHPLLTVNADLGWTDYKKWDALTFNMDRKLEFLSAAKILSPENATNTTLKLPFGFKSVWNLGLGFTLHASSRLDLRAGVEFRDSVIPDNRRSTFAPFGGANLYGVGMGYKWDKNTQLDANISYLRSVEYVPANTSCVMNCDNLTNIIYNPYAGLDVKTSLQFAAIGLKLTKKF
jgi:long-subunit fatty acid transport protein